VVLADLRIDAVRELAANFPEITLILFRGRGDSHPPERINRTIIASIYGEARYMGDLLLTWDGGAPVPTPAGRAVLLEERIPASEAVARASSGWYRAAVKGRTFDLKQTGRGWSRIRPFRAEPGNGYVGSEACRKCHAGEYRKWKESKHAHAMESLARDGSEWSPECIVCHVVGYGAEDGYVSLERTPHLGQVGCEACHGPGKALLAGECKGIARRGEEATCRGCHTPKHHPGFVYEEHWKVIEHGNDEESGF
jgi:hypothetical protein